VSADDRSAQDLSSGDAPTGPARAGRPGDPVPRLRRRQISGRLTAAVAELFPQPERVPLGWRRVTLAAAAVAVGTAISLGRTTGTGPFQSIWEEDARDLLTDALIAPGAFNLVKPFVGYFQLLPRLMGEVAAFVPISWAAAALSV
jgi:hypothetical protein